MTTQEKLIRNKQSLIELAESLHAIISLYSYLS